MRRQVIIARAAKTIRKDMFDHHDHECVDGAFSGWMSRKYVPASLIFSGQHDPSAMSYYYQCSEAEGRIPI